mmetsp:Transcript_43149/g.100060  ORF Transcript_43149/g.100060 Transcript_43149/m.100060 type:complete len:160 (+) Transcript_43149:2-481(+)
MDKPSHEKYWVSGFGGHRHTPDPGVRARSDPNAEGPLALEGPKWHKVHDQQALGYMGRPGFIPKTWTVHNHDPTTFAERRKVAKKNLEHEVAGHPSRAEWKQDYRRAWHTTAPPYAGHMPLRWGPEDPTTRPPPDPKVVFADGVPFWDRKNRRAIPVRM